MHRSAHNLYGLTRTYWMPQERTHVQQLDDAAEMHDADVAVSTVVRAGLVSGNLAL